MRIENGEIHEDRNAVSTLIKLLYETTQELESYKRLYHDELMKCLQLQSEMDKIKERGGVADKIEIAPRRSNQSY